MLNKLSNFKMIIIIILINIDKTVRILRKLREYTYKITHI